MVPDVPLSLTNLKFTWIRCLWWHQYAEALYLDSGTVSMGYSSILFIKPLVLKHY